MNIIDFGQNMLLGIANLVDWTNRPISKTINVTPLAILGAGLGTALVVCIALKIKSLILA